MKGTGDATIDAIMNWVGLGFFVCLLLIFLMVWAVRTVVKEWK